MYKGLVPETVTAGMLEAACHRPFDAAALIDVEALTTLEVAKSEKGARTLVSLTHIGNHWQR
jgi:hypothetical protein